MSLEKSLLLQSIKDVILESRKQISRTVNTSLLQTYWQIGKLIIQDEQDGKSKATYGKATLKNLSVQLTFEFGKGFDESNLRNMRSFFMSFPIRDALRHELSWTHYRLLSRLELKRSGTITLEKAFLEVGIAEHFNAK